MFNTKTQFYQANSTGRFQFSFKPSLELALPNLTPSASTGNTHKWFTDKDSDKLNAQRSHGKSTISGHWEELQIGKKTFSFANTCSEKMTDIADMMQRKVRVSELHIKRNQIPVRTLGDKIYSSPEYEHDYFRKDSGLIPGSNVRSRSRHPFMISKKFH